jgi:hypothetical protein
VAREGQLGVYHEDAGAPFWNVGGRSNGLAAGIVVICVQVQKRGFREVELARDSLKSFGRGLQSGWYEDEGERVAFKLRFGLCHIVSVGIFEMDRQEAEVCMYSEVV